MHFLIRISVGLIIAFQIGLPATASGGAVNPAEIPAINDFLGEGLSRMHELAPAQTEQFGRLVGLWTTEAEVRRQDGTWVNSAPGVWAWKYTMDGFAVSDLFYQGKESLPSYMADLGRDYMLTANRIYDVKASVWQIAWMANGAGSVMGADFGTFTAVEDHDEMVMSSPPGDGALGLQRVVFYDIEKNSFRWKSEYSTDGGDSWNAVMKIHATRVD
jgi:hypothetical protein